MNEIHALAAEIEKYLSEHPFAADSAEGIIKWWIEQQRYINARSNVIEALEDLVERGVVKKVNIPGSVLYSCSKKPDTNN